MNESVVRVEDLIKRYGNRMAINGINFEIQKGEVFGLLGPNGAGKTTTLECLEGMRTADGGKICVANCNPQNDGRRLRRKLGVQLQSSSLPESIHVDEAMLLICAWHGLPNRTDLLKRFGMEELAKKQYKELSTGQKRRLHLALALANDPEVVVLDEPTAGLDVQGRAQLHEEIRSLQKHEVTVLIATHDMAEAEELCDRIAIIIRGKIGVIGTPSQVTAAGNRKTRIRICTENASLMPGEDIGGARFVKAEEGYIEWVCRDVAASVREILDRVEAAHDAVKDLRVERPSLEERFLELVEGAEHR